MYKGFLSGLFWGGMVGVLVLAVLSLYAPLPVTQADVGAGAQAPAPAAETEEATSEPAKLTETPKPEDTTQTSEPADVPEAETEPASEPAEPEAEPEPQDTGAVGSPEATPQVVETVAPTPDTSDAENPTEQASNVATANPPEADAPEVVTNLETPKFQGPSDIEPVKLPHVVQPDVQAPAAPNTLAKADNAPADQPLVVTDKPMATLPVAVLKTAPDALGFADDVTVRRAPNLQATADQSPQTTTTALAAPEISELAPKPVENPAVVRVASRTPKTAIKLPQVGGDETQVSADTPIGVEVEPIENPVAASALKVVTGRLPTVGGDTSSVPQATQTAIAAPEQPSQGALIDHAEPFSTNAQALFSIVIIDVGDAGIPREQLFNSSYPITVAIDPAAPNAAALMSQYRTAGIEVVALLNDLPNAAAPSDVEVAVAGYFNVVDQAVAIMEPLDKRFQNDRALLQPVLGAIADTGHGFMTYTQGLNTTRQAAKRAGVPSAEIFRILDAEGENSTKIKRYLKRAAFNAGKDGSVVVVGRSVADTMTAILEWALENNDSALSLAPISAILKTDLSQGS